VSISNHFCAAVGERTWAYFEEAALATPWLLEALLRACLARASVGGRTIHFLHWRAWLGERCVGTHSAPAVFVTSRWNKMAGLMKGYFFGSC
jgi:hypothetical protein